MNKFLLFMIPASLLLMAISGYALYKQRLAFMPICSVREVSAHPHDYLGKRIWLCGFYYHPRRMVGLIPALNALSATDVGKWLVSENPHAVQETTDIRLSRQQTPEFVSPITLNVTGPGLIVVVFPDGLGMGNVAHNAYLTFPGRLVEVFRKNPTRPAETPPEASRQDGLARYVFLADDPQEPR